jgi:hypothetical protein
MTEVFGQILSEAKATYTITNIGHGTLTIGENVATTGVATASVDNTQLTAGQSATLTVSIPVGAPYGEKTGEVTVMVGQERFTINYTATTMNPNALDEHFTAGQPTGWYFGGSWEVSGGVATSESSSTVGDLITQQLKVAGPADLLTFQAARTSSYSAPTFRVYTSADRVTWDEYDVSGTELTTAPQTISITGLEEGKYYLRISGVRVKVDDFLGWEKVDNSRDLYVASATIPTTLTASYSASVTVANLIAENEEGVYATLFFGDDEMATAEPQDIARNESKTFALATTEAPTDGAYQARIVVYYGDGTVAFETASVDVVSLTLYDDDDFTDEMAGEYPSVKVNRSFNAGWGTVVLPFTVDAETVAEKFGEQTKLYTLSSYDDVTGELTFTKQSSITIEAGKPYLINLPAAIAQGDLVFENVEIVATEDNVELGNGAQFKGNYDAGMSMSGKYGVTPQGKMAKGGIYSTMKAFRAYIELPEDAAPARLIVSDESTGISRVLSAEEAEHADVFNLKGQRVGQLAKGMLIIGGKKVIKK